MKKRWKFLVMLGWVLWLVPIGSREPPRTQPVVSRVEVTCSRNGQVRTWHYTQPGKMTQVLNFLRTRETLGVADTDPERIRGSAYRVEVHLSDGGCRVYRLRADRYYSPDGHPWQKVDGDKASILALLLAQLPSDEESLPQVRQAGFYLWVRTHFPF